MVLQNGQGGVAISFADEHAKADPHIIDLVHLGVADSPLGLNQLKDWGYRRQVVYHETYFGIDPGQVQQPVPGDVDQGFHRGDIVDDREYLRHINQSWAQELFPQGNAEFGENVVDREFALFEKDVARQGQTVAVDAAAFEPDDDVPGDEVTAGDDPVERHQSDSRSDQVEAAHHVLEGRNFTAGDRNAGLLGAG